MRHFAEVRDTLLEGLGLLFLRVALALLPEDASAKTGALRGLAEQRAFDRYEGFTLLLNQEPLPFDRWRETFQWIHTKMRQRDSRSVREAVSQ